MGFMDKMKGAVGGAAGLDPSVIEKINGRVMDTAISYANSDSVTEFVEDQAKSTITDQLVGATQSLLPNRNVIVEKLHEKACEKAVDTSWEKIKEKILEKLEEKKQKEY
jgi:ribosomal protein S3AE